MSRLLVTGAGGFIGREFCRHALETGNEVHALVRREMPDVPGVVQIVTDITEVESDLLPNGLDGILHLASGTSGTDDAVIRVAVDGTTAIFEAAAEAGVPRLVHVSSLSVYPGRTPTRAPAAERRDEDLDPHPELRGAYAASKILAEKALLASVEQRKPASPAITVVRPGLVFGPGMSAPLAGSGALAPLGFVVLQGEASQRVPVIDANDILRGLLALLETDGSWPTWRVFDVLPIDLPTKRELVDAFGHASGQPTRLVKLPRRAVGVAARLTDRVHSSANSATRYKVDRAYEFEPSALPAAEFWREVGIEPQVNTRESLCNALTFAGPTERTISGAIASPARLALDFLALNRTEPPAPSGDWVLVGAGRVVRDLHGPALDWLGERVAAVIDADLAVAEAAAASLPTAHAATHLEELPAALLEGATAVIATPGFTHEELAHEALNRGCHLVIEKPPALGATALESLREAAARNSATVTVIQNYRLRGNVIEMWKFLASHDVGVLLRAHVEFHTGNLLTEPARWMRAEREHRTLLFELGIHFIDLACVIGGGLRGEPAVETWPSRVGDGLATATATGRFERGAIFELALSAGGPARRTTVTLEFQRAVIELSFFPEGFRVLPPRRTPIDDMAASVRELGGFARQIFERRRRSAPRHSPHQLIYAAHSAARDGRESNPFSLDSTAPTISTLEKIGDGWYGP